MFNHLLKRCLQLSLCCFLIGQNLTAEEVEISNKEQSSQELVPIKDNQLLTSARRVFKKKKQFNSRCQQSCPQTCSICPQKSSDSDPCSRHSRGPICEFLSVFTDETVTETYTYGQIKNVRFKSVSTNTGFVDISTVPEDGIFRKCQPGIYLCGWTLNFHIFRPDSVPSILNEFISVGFKNITTDSYFLPVPFNSLFLNTSTDVDSGQSISGQTQIIVPICSDIALNVLVRLLPDPDSTAQAQTHLDEPTFWMMKISDL